MIGMSRRARGFRELSFHVAGKQGRREQLVRHDALQRFQHSFTARREFSEQVLALESERYRKLSDIVLTTPFFFSDLYVSPPPDMLAKQTGGDRALASQLLADYGAVHDQCASESGWQQAAYALAMRRGLKPGTVFILLRLALTGSDRNRHYFRSPCSLARPRCSDG